MTYKYRAIPMKLKRNTKARDEVLDRWFYAINKTNAPLLRQAFLEMLNAAGFEITRKENP